MRRSLITSEQALLVRERTQIPATPLANVRAALARTHFAERTQAARSSGFASYDPWSHQNPTGDPGFTDDAGTALWALLNRAEPERERIEQGLWADLCELDLAEEPDRAGRWRLTAHRNLIVACDRPRGEQRGHVPIGEDSLRFAESILGEAPRGVALDVGCGSGISSCALGRTCERVHSIDVVAECLQATEFSASLNGIADRVSVQSADLASFDAGGFDCVVGNLPGVPVPDGLNYPPDGDGGPDGLLHMRTFLKRCRDWRSEEPGVVILRFQSLGNDSGPAFVEELQAVATGSRWGISVLTESRIPVEVRAALTAHHALVANPASGPQELLDRADAHLAASGYADYHCSTLIARPGNGTLTHTNLASKSLVHRPLRLAARTLRAERAAAVARYYSRARDLPDSFWELGSAAYVIDPVRRLEWIIDTLASRATVADVVQRVFADELARDPIRARFLYVTVELLSSCLFDDGLLADAL